MKLINKRHTPKYKSFLRLRENVTGDNKFLKFRKKKWVRLVKRSQTFNRRIKIVNYNHRISYITRYAKRLKNNFRTQLYNKQRLSIFYGKLKERQLKKSIRAAFFKSQVIQKATLKKKEDLFISFLESRVDSIIFRTGFFSSFREIRQVIANGHVYVNNKQILSGNNLLKKGDFITFSSPVAKLIDKNFKLWRNKRLIKIYPSYLEVNFKVLTIVLIESITLSKLQQFFPFWLDLKTMFHRYS